MNYCGVWAWGVDYEIGSAVTLSGGRVWFKTADGDDFRPPNESLLWTALSTAVAAPFSLSGSGPPSVPAPPDVVYYDTASDDLWVSTSDGWELETAEPARPAWSDKDREFLLALYNDPGQIALMLRNGVLVNDANETILRLTAEERRHGKRLFDAMAVKIRSMFCVVCKNLADDGLCEQCRTRLVRELRWVQRDRTEASE